MSQFCIRSLKSANNVGNINTAKSIPENRNQFASRQKGFGDRFDKLPLMSTPILELYYRSNLGKIFLFEIIGEGICL